MEHWEETIEQYKRELMRYAKENGVNYAAAQEPAGEQEAASTPDATSTQDAALTPDAAVMETETEQTVPVWQKYKKDRPMPAEYAGEEAAANETAAPAAPEKPENDELTPGSERAYGSFEEFTKENPAMGVLRIQAFAAQQAFPIVNAKIEVEKEFDDGVHTFAQAYTDINGVVENIRLPTKNKSLSQSPGGVIPYATYTIKVTHPHFAPTVFCEVPIFDGIESLQPVAMVQAARK